MLWSWWATLCKLFYDVHNSNWHFKVPFCPQCKGIMVFRGWPLWFQCILPEYHKPVWWRRLGQRNIDLVEWVGDFPNCMCLLMMGNRWVFRNDPCTKNTTPKDYKSTVALLAIQCAAHKKAAAEASQVAAQERESAAQGHKSAVQESELDGKESKSASEGSKSARKGSKLAGKGSKLAGKGSKSASKESESAGKGSKSAANSKEHKSVTFDSPSDKDH